MTPLERVARAVREVLPVETDFGDGTFVVSPTFHEDDLRNIARAVLTAIREPSEGMSNAGMDADDHIEFNNHGRIWQAMINAALDEKP